MSTSSASITAYSESQTAKSAGGCRKVWRKVIVEPSTRCHSSISPSSRMKKPTARTTSEAGERPAARRPRQRTRQRARAIASSTTSTISTGASSATMRAARVGSQNRQPPRDAMMITVTRRACTKREGPRRAGRRRAWVLRSESGELTSTWATLPRDCRRTVRRRMRVLSRQRVLLIGLLIAAAIVYGLPLGARNLWNQDEARMALLAEDSLSSGFRLPVRVRDQPYLNKPPLFFWSIALASLPAGHVSAATASLPSVVSALAALGGVFALGRHLSGTSTGILAIAILGTSPGFFLHSHAVLPDMMLTA